MQHVLLVTQRWLGTPFVHQASQCQYGCDCLGLIRGVWRDVIGHEPCHIPHYSVGRLRQSELTALRRQLDTYLLACTIDLQRAGSVIGFSLGQGALLNHLGILSGAGTMIHAHSRHGVIESFINQSWQNRVVAQYQFPI